LWWAAFNDQLLNGDGTTPDLKGLNTSGNFTAATGTSTVPAEQLVQALLQMRILKRRATGIIINPASIEGILLNKAEGSGEYDLPSLISYSPSGQIMVMGVPVVDVAEQPADTFTLHDQTGSFLAWRNQLVIEFFNEIYAKTNKILIRIEARAAFPVYGASYTVKGTFAPES
jgi:HK97 family phage major capsid protein